jgi:hypothetical protein
MTPNTINTHDSHLLAVRATESLGPADLTGVTLHLEVLVALGRAETEALGVVTDEHGAVTGVHRDGAAARRVSTVDKGRCSATHK